VICRRAHQIDLLEFLAAPDFADFENFRQHYPRCPKCSAELRAWTELHQILAVGSGSNHPEPALLERFDRAAATFAAEDRRRIEAHLTTCAACRDELQALRHYAPDHLAAADPPPPDRLRWFARGREVFDQSIRVVWHPAFAYALVGVLLFPLLHRSVGPTPDTSLPEPSAELASKATHAAEPAPFAEVPESPSADESLTARAQASPDALRRDAPQRQLAKETPLAAPEAKFEAEERPAAEGDEPLYHGVRTRELQGAIADLHERNIYVPTLRLHRGTVSRAPLRELSEGVLLEVPLPRDQPGGWATVRVVAENPLSDAQGLAARSAGRLTPAEEAAEADHRVKPQTIEEARPVEPMQRAIVVHIPRQWLNGGRYRIDLELRDPARTSVIGRGRYRLKVEAE